MIYEKVKQMKKIKVNKETARLVSIIYAVIIVSVMVIMPFIITLVRVSARKQFPMVVVSCVIIAMVLFIIGYLLSGIEEEEPDVNKYAKYASLYNPSINGNEQQVQQSHEENEAIELVLSFIMLVVILLFILLIKRCVFEIFLSV